MPKNGKCRVGIWRIFHSGNCKDKPSKIQLVGQKNLVILFISCVSLEYFVIFYPKVLLWIVTLMSDYYLKLHVRLATSLTHMQK